jgi:DNA-binding Xre family transcriptional regulator
MIKEIILNQIALLGWSAAELSRQSGVRYLTVNFFLIHNKGISCENLEKICSVLNLTLTRTLTEEEENDLFINKMNQVLNKVNSEK